MTTDFHELPDDHKAKALDRVANRVIDALNAEGLSVGEAAGGMILAMEKVLHTIHSSAPDFLPGVLRGLRGMADESEERLT